MKITKAIGYAYPSSINAEKFGFPNTGCYYIEYTIKHKGFHWLRDDDQAGGFESVCQDLLDSFNEADGEPCSISLRNRPQYYKTNNQKQDK